MRIGMMHGDDGRQTLEQQIQQLVDEEKDGFECAWFGQIFGNDSMTTIALAGQRTTKIEFGTAVVPTYPRHPFAMAQQAMTVYAATQGRFTLGIGPSHQMVVENMWGMSYDKPAKHIREYLDVLIPLCRDGRVGHNGDLYKTNAGVAVAELKDLKPMPIIISALAPVMLKLAGTLADGTTTWMTGPRTIESHVRPAVTKAAAEAGRPAPRIVVGLPICVTDDAAGAREAAAKGFVVYGQLPNYRRMLDKEGAAGPADVAIVGNEDEVEAQIRGIASAGATDFNAALFPVGPDAAQSIARTRALLQSLIGKV